MRTCWRCHGDGEVHFNRTWNRDPQADESARCDICHGDGEIEDGVTIEELKSYSPGQVLDVTLIGAEHELASRVKHAGETMRMKFERLDVTMNPVQVFPITLPGGRMLSPTSQMVWGKAIISDVPEHVFVPPMADLYKEPDSLRYGFHEFLIRDIQVVG